MTTPFAAAAPVVPSNPPGKAQIAYRIGDFASFRAAMLERLVSADLFSDCPLNPFRDWRDRGGTDYATIFLELWAYVGDVLTFYQERIANEAFVQTATQRDSVLRLARLVEYRPRPGAAASALVAFSAAANATVSVPAGFGLTTQPPPGQPPATFETAAAVVVDGTASAIPLAPAQPQPQFGPIPGTTVTRTVVLDGTSTRLNAGDDVLVVQLAGTAHELVDVRRLISVDADDAAQTTIAWREPGSIAYSDPADNPVQILALRVSATPFGSTAPNWYALPPALTQTTSPPGPYADTNWDQPGATPAVNPWPFLPLPAAATSPPNDAAQRIYLDGVYDVRSATRLALFGNDRSGAAMHDTFVVTDARTSAVSAYAISGKATLLVLQPPIPAARGYTVRGTTVLAGSEQLARHDDVPLPLNLSGEVLILSGLHPELLAGRTIVVRGTDWNATAAPAIVAESAVVASTKPIAKRLTQVTLTASLAHEYVRAQTSVLANIASATHGATVKDEVLGSGDASAFQRYRLQEAPLTYLPATGPEGLDALQSTLTVVVNGVAWREQPSLYDEAPDAQAYTVEQDAANRTSVAFGDGVSGARPPTGVDNVRARYRFGLGSAGNVGAGVIAQLADSAAGLEGVTNPLPALGGVDPETTDEIRANAPVQAATFGRAVTARDVEALALAYPGVAKATAVLRRLRAAGSALSQRSVFLTVAGPDPKPGNKDAFAALSQRLHTYLDARRDVRLPIQIAAFTPLYVAFAVTVDVDDAYPRKATLDAVTAALSPAAAAGGAPGFFAFERRTFDETLSLAAIYALVQRIRGVANARITRFACIVDRPYPNVVREELHAAPRELFVALDDRANPEHGTVIVTYGKGGFADT